MNLWKFKHRKLLEQFDTRNWVESILHNQAALQIDEKLAELIKKFEGTFGDFA